MIIIGPNNCGKSTALKDIEYKFMQHAGLVFSVSNWIVNGTRADFEEWMDENYARTTSMRKNNYSTRGSAGDKSSLTLFDLIHSGRAFNSWINTFLYARIDAASRLGMVNPVPVLGRWNDPPAHYLHVLQTDDSLTKAVSDEVKRTFNVGLVLDRGGSAISLRVDEEPSRTALLDRVSPDYLAKVDCLPPLENEGDGIRSYVGLLLEVKCGAHPVLLIDEPEAFLHPPQVRRLAGLLARAAETQNRQIIIATHSRDVLRGALDASSRVTVCRLTRSGNVSHAASLGIADIRSFWSKPLLRSAAAFDGVFHKAAIVCEADADSRFYEAVLHTIEEQNEITFPPDYFFVHGGGKGELATLASAYSALSVPVAVIADIDVLRNKAEFEKLFVSLGGDFSQISTRFNGVKSALGGLVPDVSTADLVRRIREIAEQIEQDARLAAGYRREIENLIRESADWSQAKRYGIDKLREEHEETLRRSSRRARDAACSWFLAASWKDGGQQGQQRNPNGSSRQSIGCRKPLATLWQHAGFCPR